MSDLETFNYYGDRRVIQSMVIGDPLILKVDKRNQKILVSEEVIDYVEEDLEKEISKDLEKVEYKETVGYVVSAEVKNSLCGMCDGDGTVVNPSIDSSGLTYEDFEEDPGFEEAYFDGTYDIECPGCKGEKVVHSVVLPNRGTSLTSVILSSISKIEQERLDDAEERANEIRWGY